jgi:hypothetical protein
MGAELAFFKVFPRDGAKEDKDEYTGLLLKANLGKEACYKLMSNTEELKKT